MNFMNFWMDFLILIVLIVNNKLIFICSPYVLKCFGFDHNMFLKIKVRIIVILSPKISKFSTTDLFTWVSNLFEWFSQLDCLLGSVSTRWPPCEAHVSRTALNYMSRTFTCDSHIVFHLISRYFALEWMCCGR